MGTFASTAPGVDSNQGTIVTLLAGEAITERMLCSEGTTQGYALKTTQANSASVKYVALADVANGSRGAFKVLGGGGVVEVLADDGSISVGNMVKSGTTTKTSVISAETTGTTAQHIVGRAETASQTAGDVVLISAIQNPTLNYFPALS